MEDEVDGLRFLGASLFDDVGLVFLQEFGVEADIAWFVDAVDVAEAGGDGEVGGDGGEGIMDCEDVFGLGVEGVVVYVFVVDAVFFAACNADFLYPHKKKRLASALFPK